MADEEENLPSTDEWCQKMCSEKTQCIYWHEAFMLELQILQFVKLICEANFILYHKSLTALLPMFFALDYIN